MTDGEIVGEHDSFHGVLSLLAAIYPLRTITLMVAATARTARHHFIPACGADT